MRKLSAVLALGAMLWIGATQLAEGQGEPQSAVPQPEAQQCTPAKQVYALSRWDRRNPTRGLTVCPSPGLRRVKQRFAEYRLYRQVARFHAPGGHGPRSPSDGRWWAIPWCTVAGESGGNFREANGDGAYQIIPSTWVRHGGGRYSSQASDATPLEQHIVAHRAALAGEPWYGGCGYN